MLFRSSLRDWHCDVRWAGEVPIFNPKEIVKPAEWEGKIVIGYSGGGSHLTDLKQMITPVSKVCKKYDNVIFAFYGDKRLLEAINGPENPNRIPEDKISFIEPTHFSDHPKGLFGIDIGLAPLHACEFNISKSCLKVLEGFAAGQAFIASNVGPYARIAKTHPEAVELVGDGKDCYSSWEAALTYLIENPEVLEQKKINNRKLCIEHYALERNFHFWPKHWKTLMDNLTLGKAGPRAVKVKKLWANIERNAACPCGSKNANGEPMKYKNCCRSAWG